MKTNPLPTLRIALLKPAVSLFAGLILSLAGVASSQAQNGTWTNLMANGSASGTWSAATNWLSGSIAGGSSSTADFSTLDLTGTTTVTLDGNRTNGLVIIGDTVPNTNWTFNAGTPATSALYLSATPGPSVINVSNQLATFGAPIYSSDGFIKAGAGTLRMNNSNTNTGGWLNGLIVVTNGILQCGNGSIGIAGNQNGTNRVVVLEGATVEVISTIGVNNKHLTIGGSGVGGTKGALYAFPPTNNVNSTRWGLSSVNDSFVSANSSAAFPAITLATNATVYVDGLNYTYVFLLGYTTSTTNNFTLTKTGPGRISFDRGANVSNIVVNAGSVSPNSPNAFGAVQTWTINNGGAILTWQASSFGSGAAMTVNAGGVWDINGRNDSLGTGYTETVGFLTGAGTITHGLNGANVATILAVNNNSSFSGPIQVATGVLHLVKNTAGTTLALSGTNSYNGITTVNAGTLLVNGVHTGGSNYVVATGATLGGSGTILPTNNLPITLNGAGSLLVAGNNGGTLTVNSVLGAGDVIVSNANLTVLGQLNNSGSGSLNSIYLTNSLTTVKLQQGGTEASIYAATVNIDGTNNTLSFTSANPAIGQFPFIKYGSLGGLHGFAGLKLAPPSGVAAYLSNNVANSSIDIVVTGIPALTWNGTPTGDWTIGGSANWLNVATPSAYTETGGQGPFVVFNDSAAGTTNVNLTTTVTPKGVTVNSTKNYTFTGSGVINSNASWIKDGSGTLTIANSGSNTITGVITINNGAIALGNGGTAGNLGSAYITNAGSLIFNRSDNVSFGNVITGSGALVKQAANTVTLRGVGDVSGPITVSNGTLALAPAGTITVSGDVTGAGAFGMTGSGTVVLTSANITYTGGSVISNGTLQLNSVFPPSGNIIDNGTLALGVGGTLANNISGAGGVSLVNNSAVTLAGANTYAGPTMVLGGSVDATAANYSPASVLRLGNQTSGAQIGTANFTAGNPVLGGLTAGGNSSSPVNTINLTGGNQTLVINGNVTLGNPGPAGAAVGLSVTGSGGALVVNTNGGIIQLGLGATGSGVNPDSIFADLSGIDTFVANLGATGLVNLGTVDGNPGPPAGATVVNWFNLAAVSNQITAGAINIGAGGRQLVPELRLGAGTNILNVSTLGLGSGQSSGGRDGGYLHFLGDTGGLRLRGNDGISRAVFNVGVNPVTGTGANIANTVDFTGHPVDLLVSTLVIGAYNNAGTYQNTFTFDTGILDAQATSLSAVRNNNANAAASGSTLNLGGGAAALGPVSLTASAAYGTLNISGGAVVTANKITSPGTGTATLSLSGATLNLSLTNNGNPATAPVIVDVFNASGAVNLGVTGNQLTTGQFALISYTGSIGGDGFPALNLASLPAGVSGYLSNNPANLSVDLVITNAPVYVSTNPTNITTTVVGNTLTLSWPADHAGWHLQVQTNALATGLGTNWVTIPNSNLSNSYTNTLNPANGTVFYRMVYP